MNTTLDLIYQLIEDSRLVELIQALDGEQLLQVIDHVGVEDAGDFMLLASPTQLTQIFDNVFWKNSKPGGREQFDPHQFALWLEIAWEHSADTAKKIINDIDDELLTLGLAENLIVIDHESFLLRMQNSARSFEDDLLDKLLDSDRLMEWSNYFIIPRTGTSWDAIIAILVDIDNEDSDRVNRMLETINHISTEYIQDNGELYQVLTSCEMLESDLAAAREGRREKQGYVSPESAVAFLQQAQITTLDELISSPKYDYLTSCYFAAFSPTERAQMRSKTSRTGVLEYISNSFPGTGYQFSDTAKKVSLGIEKLPMEPEKKTPQADITSALQLIKREEPQNFNKYIYELNYLANVLIAGDISTNRQLTPVEAAERTIQVCQAGVLHILDSGQKIHPHSIKQQIFNNGLVKLFRIGWNITASSRNQE
ncbi:DUF6178 family protein [Desulfogranum japonicum]|uniref:DUF6178 family protein n=1 Tax=Desulfogranum japonicum TaxID=231447 RepID=UPI0004902EC2|nr:DUF6178 family protein [Desulfogranum japonicum]